MNKIDAYVDEICNQFDETDEEISSLKEEMKSHLYEEVDDFKQKGFSEEESIEKALDSFGKEKNIVKDMSIIWEKDNDFALFFLKITGFTFILGCIFMLISMFYKNSTVESINVTSEYTINKIFTQIIDKNIISSPEIEKTLNDFNSKNNNGLFYVKIEHLNTLEYEYNKDISSDMIKNNYDGKIIEHSWCIYYKKTDIQQENDITNLSKLTDLNTKPLASTLKELGSSLFLICSFLLCMSFYAFMGKKFSPVLDFGIGAGGLAELFFPKHFIIALICFWIAFLLVYYLLRVYFVKSRKKLAK